MWTAVGSSSGSSQGNGCTATIRSRDHSPASLGDRLGERGRSRSPARSAPCAAPEAKPHGDQLIGVNSSKYELQHQHLRLRRKFEERKKRYEQEKEAWVKEKEALLREVLEMQAGENRRILLDLKSLLQVVQIQLRREEKKNSSVQLQYAKDRCAWELERAELKYYIAQLESKASSSCDDKTTPNLQETFKTETEEQKRLLPDAHSAAMDLHKQLESTERNWKMEKMELLERFDSERKEWECQWKVMQKKIEELYQEVKLRRESNGKNQDDSIQAKVLEFSVHSPCSEFTMQDGTAKEVSHLSATDYKNPQTVSKKETHELSVDYLVCGSHEVSESCNGSKSSKKENGTLSQALSEIAKVSKELCSYQEEIRKKSHRRRMKSYPLLGEYEEPENMTGKSVMSCVPASVQTASSVISQRDEFNNRKNQKDAILESNPCNSTNGDAVYMDKPTFTSKEAPPVPPRSTSWNLSNMLTVSPQANNVSTQVLGSSWASQQGKSGTNIGCIDFGNKCKASSQANQGMPSKYTTKGSMSLFSEKKATASVCNANVCQSKLVHTEGKFEKDTNSCDMSLHHINGWSSNRGLPRSTDRKCGGNFEQLSNGKLSVKTEEFNRIVSKTNKCTIALPENLQSLTPTDNQEQSKHSSSSLCSCRDTSFGIDNAVRLSDPSLLVCKRETACSKGIITTSGHQKQMNGFQGSSSYQQMLHEHDWRPTNLSGRPRSADSRSNYGVVEKLLKNLEKSAGPTFCHSKGAGDKWTKSVSEFRVRGTETLNQYLEMLQTEQPTKDVLQNTPRPARNPCKQEPGTGKLNFPEMSSSSKSLSQKGFSRPACPANRRLPSRWASRSSSAPLSLGGREHSNSFAFLSETSVV
ncbi:uncharacterized protein KIAA0408 homolog [Pleurodeles waltl]|uniref:uncharacterized protein KIAA0408 homolog n=1 Tax=Pleurodeles waltl TaxID=8319 RepID=UPI0037099A09